MRHPTRIEVGDVDVGAGSLGDGVRHCLGIARLGPLMTATYSY